MDKCALIKKYDVVTFLSEEYVKSKFKGLCKSIQINKYKNLKSKFFRKGIELILISEEDKIKIREDSNLMFNDSDSVKFNELYFRLDNKSETLYKYYTVDEIESKTEEFKQNLFFYIMSHFGLSQAKLEYFNNEINLEQLKTDISNNLTINGVNLVDIGAGFEVDNEDSTENNVANTRNFENIGFPSFFECFTGRSYWCDKYYGKLECINDKVLNILDKNEEYTYKCYKYDSKLKSILESRLNGSSTILYEIKVSSKHRKSFKYFSSIGVSIPGFGYRGGVNTQYTNEDSKIKHRILTVNFYPIKEMEIKTLANILEKNNCNNDTESIDELKETFNTLDSEYNNSLLENINKLNSIDIEEVNNSNNNIKLNRDKIDKYIMKIRDKGNKQKKIKNKVFKKVEDKKKDKEYESNKQKLNELKKKSEKQKEEYKFIMEARKYQKEYIKNLVPHLSNWDIKYKKWNCCGKRIFVSSCTKIEPIHFDKNNDEKYDQYTFNGYIDYFNKLNNQFPKKAINPIYNGTMTSKDKFYNGKQKEINNLENNLKNINRIKSLDSIDPEYNMNNSDELIISGDESVTSLPSQLDDTSSTISFSNNEDDATGGDNNVVNNVFNSVNSADNDNNGDNVDNISANNADNGDNGDNSGDNADNVDNVVNSDDNVVNSGDNDNNADNVDNVVNSGDNADNVDNGDDNGDNVDNGDNSGDNSGDNGDNSGDNGDNSGDK